MAVDRLKEARRTITELEQKIIALQAENAELAGHVNSVRTDYNTVNTKMMDLHRFVKDVAQGRTKHKEDAQALLMDDTE